MRRRDQALEPATLDALLALLDPDVEFPTSLPDGAVYRGHDGLRAVRR